MSTTYGRWLACGPGGVHGRLITSSGQVIGASTDLDVDCECCCPQLCTSYTVNGAITQGMDEDGSSDTPAFAQPPTQSLNYAADGSGGTGLPTEGCGVYIENPGNPPQTADFSLTWNSGGYSFFTPIICGYWQLQAAVAGGGGSTPMFGSWVKTTAGGDAAGTYVATSDAVGALTLPSTITVSSNC